MKKRIFAMFLIFIMSCSMVVPVYADKIDDLKKQQKDTQEKLDEANDNIKDIESEKKGITEEIEALDNQVVEIMTAISLLEDELAELEKELVVVQKDYEAAKAEEEKQYAAMKIRLKYLYEKGDTDSISLLMGASNFTDMVNRADYIEKVHAYDQNMLKEYTKIKEEVETKRIELETYQSELETGKNELELEKTELNKLLEEKKQQEEDYETQLAKAKQEAAAYKAKLKQQNSQIKKLEDEKRKQEEAKKKQNGGGGGKNPSDVIGGSNGSASGKEIATYACKFVGNPYVSGGTSLTNGADCSGFTMAVYQHFGYSIPRTSTAQRSAGRGVTYEEAQPGDIICYAGHVAIYIGGGQIVHASTPATGIKYGNATYRPILAVRRIVK